MKLLNCWIIKIMKFKVSWLLHKSILIFLLKRSNYACISFYDLTNQNNFDNIISILIVKYIMFIVMFMIKETIINKYDILKKEWFCNFCIIQQFLLSCYKIVIFSKCINIEYNMIKDLFYKIYEQIYFIL